MVYTFPNLAEMHSLSGILTSNVQAVMATVDCNNIGKEGVKISSEDDGDSDATGEYEEEIDKENPECAKIVDQLGAPTRTPNCPISPIELQHSRFGMGSRVMLLGSPISLCVICVSFQIAVLSLCSYIFLLLKRNIRGHKQLISGENIIYHAYELVCS